MRNVEDSLVLVSAKALDDVLELSRSLVERLDHNDPLAIALRGAIAQARADVILEP